MRYILKSIIAAAVSLFSIYATAQDNWPDKLYCRGGLADKSAWNPTKNYPLNHVGDGKYEGTVDVDASNEDSGDYYGNRSDLFFSYGNDDNRILSCPYSNIERFLTPAICEGPLQEYSQPENVYQTNGGSYFVNVDLKAMTVKITPLDTGNIAWMPEVFLVGTNYEEYWGRNGKSLPHIGGGIYRGTVHLLEGVNNPGYAEATVFATYTHRRDLNWAEGRYGSSDDLKVLQPGETAHCTRYYGDRKWLIAPGWYDVLFDMNRLNYDERGKLLGEFNDGDSILVVLDDNEFYITDFDANNHYEDNIRIIEKWNPGKVWTAVLYDADNDNYPYIKRFCMEATKRHQNFLGDNPQSRLVLLTDTVYPRIRVTFKPVEGRDGNSTQRPPMEIDMEQFVGVKGFKAKGKRICTWEVEDIEELEPLRMPEPEPEDEPDGGEEPEEEPENLDPDAGKSRQQVIDEMTGQLNLFGDDDM